jgi:hypothetical protein
VSLGTTQEWLDADQHVEDWHMKNALSESAYAETMIRREKISGPPTRYQDELSTDGRNIYKDHCGFYRPTKEELANDK